MTNFEETACKPTELLSMTGYTFDEFNALLPAFEQAVFECDRTLEGKERENKPTVYKNSPFPSIADQLFFILVYMKQYTTQTVLGKNCLESLSRKANLWIHYLMPILSSALDILKVAPIRNMQDIHEEEASVYSHDGTERPIQRPKDGEKQKEILQRKKEKHILSKITYLQIRTVKLFF